MESFMNEFRNQVQENEDALFNYVQKISKFEAISSEDEIYYARMAQSGDNLARKILIQANLKLVINVAKKSIHICKLPLIDLIQEGNLGLMVAIDKFNWRLGYKFATYATWWIKQAMFKAISEQAYAMKIPVYVQETLSKYKKVKSELEQKFNCEIKNSTVAEAMGLSEDKIDAFLNAYTKAISFEMQLGEETNSMTLSEIIEDVNENLETEVEIKQMKRDVYRALNCLKDKEKEVLTLRFGLYETEPKTLLEIGKSFGVTKECVRQMQKRAIQKLCSHEQLRDVLSCYVA